MTKAELLSIKIIRAEDKMLKSKIEEELVVYAEAFSIHTSCVT